MKTYDEYANQFMGELLRGLITGAEYDRAMYLLDNGFYTTDDDSAYVETVAY